MNLKVGQKVFVRMVGNNARYLDRNKSPIEDYISEANVSKVGRKYFYLEGWKYARKKFDIDCGFNVSDYMAEFIVYENKQDILDENEYKELEVLIKDTFSFGSRHKMSLDQLRKINEIIKETK